MEPDHLVLRPRKMRSGQRFSYLALDPEETRALQRSLSPAHPPGPVQPHPYRSAGLHPKALDLLASERYLEKGMGLMLLTGRRPAEIFFSAKFSLPKKKLPFPALIFEGQLKTRHAPGTSFEPYPIPVLTDPKKLVRPSTDSDR